MEKNKDRARTCLYSHRVGSKSNVAKLGSLILCFEKYVILLYRDRFNRIIGTHLSPFLGCLSRLVCSLCLLVRLPIPCLLLSALLLRQCCSGRGEDHSTSCLAAEEGDQADADASSSNRRRRRARKERGSQERHGGKGGKWWTGGERRGEVWTGGGRGSPLLRSACFAAVLQEGEVEPRTNGGSWRRRKPTAKMGLLHTRGGWLVSCGAACPTRE